MSIRYSDEELLLDLLLDENGLPPTDNALEVIKGAIEATGEVDAWHTETGQPGGGPTVAQYTRQVIDYLREWAE